MGLRNLRRWQWAVIGVLAGLAFAYLWSPNDPTRLGRSTSATNFEQFLTRKEPDGRPWLKNIVVYPPAPADDAGPSGVVQVVTFEALTVTRDPKAPKAYIDQWFSASVPYKPRLNIPPDAGDSLTVRTYLAFVKSKNPDVGYSYAWYGNPQIAYPIFALAGLVVIGGIWPTLIYALTGGPPAKVKRETYDLDRFGKGEQSSPVPALQPVDGDAKLRELEASLEASLKGFGQDGTATEASKSDAAVRALDAQPLDELPPSSAAPVEDKSYRGEFYPTARAKKNE